MSFLTISVIVLWIIIIFQSVLIFYSTKFVAQFLQTFRLSGNQAITENLIVGEEVPLFRERDQLKREIELVSNKGKYTLLLFAGAQCGYCKELIPSLLDIQERFDLRTIVISQENLNQYHSNELSFINSEHLFKSYRIQMVPTMMLIDNKNHLVTYLDVHHSHGLKILLDNYFRNSTLNKEVV